MLGPCFERIVVMWRNALLLSMVAHEDADLVCSEVRTGIFSVDPRTVETARQGRSMNNCFPDLAASYMVHFSDLSAA